MYVLEGLFCRIDSLLWGSAAEEKYNVRGRTNRSHPIPWYTLLQRVWRDHSSCAYMCCVCVCVCGCMWVCVCECIRCYNVCGAIIVRMHVCVVCVCVCVRVCMWVYVGLCVWVYTLL